MFFFTSWLVFHEVCIHIPYFFGVVRNKLQTLNTFKWKEVNQKNIKSSRKQYVMWTFFKFWPMRVWLWLVYILTENCQIYRLFLRVDWNSKEVSYLSWQNTYPNLKTTWHVTLKFFLSIYFLKNFLLAKYLISVTVLLITYSLNRNWT